jgi:ABC-2 type transport system permease protein
MRTLNKTFNLELKRIAHNRIYSLTLFVFPTISLLFFLCYFSKSGIRELPIVVIDQNKSVLSQKLVDMIDATASVSVDYNIADFNIATSLIRRGDAYALVVIPPNFEGDILSARAANVVLYNSGANISTNGFIEKDIQTSVTSFGAGIELQRGIPLPEIMPITFEKHILFNPYLNYTYYIAPCFMAMMIMIFTMLSTVYAVAQTNIKEFKSLVGKIAPTTFTMWFFALIMLYMLYSILGVPLEGNRWLLIISTLLFVVVYQAVAIFFVGITHNRELALPLGGGYSVLAFTFSGLTFPTMAMFPILKVASHLFPFTYYMKIVIDQAIRGADSRESIINMCYMGIFLLLPLTIYRRL